MKEKTLLVEGFSDKAFFQALLKEISLEVKALTATEVGGERDCKDELRRRLPALIKNMKPNECLAAVVDADYPHPISSGVGYEGTVKQISKAIKESGYDTEPAHIGSGLSFTHSGNLKNFGLLVMSDNRSNGMFEDWIKRAINISETQLFDSAILAVKNLQNPKFRAIHTSKAEIATWMAWQRKPAEGFNSENHIRELLDFDSEPMKQLIAWLQEIYGK